MIDGEMEVKLCLSVFDEDEVVGFGESEKKVYEGLKGEDDVWGYIVDWEYEGVDVMGCWRLMSWIEYELFRKWEREFIVGKCVREMKEWGGYD